MSPNVGPDLIYINSRLISYWLELGRLEKHFKPWQVTRPLVAATALAVTVLGWGSSSAQNLPEPLEKAARKAVVTSPDVQARWHSFTTSDNERNVAKAGYFPRAWTELLLSSVVVFLMQLQLP
jgi:hypothetical protein